ncbi:hypothetical protein B0G93_10798 [Bacillus sp. V-88]|jgi:hypothetical protein|nr:hypothetical protein B1B00_09730 [Bacillus sp. DSM 27956]PRX76814.1 hypothetical protein B0G93_10798 [Bacillus sp. V-88]SLK22038.1 hypothetical protein SAMN06295884_10798 [Bacillus sp. V-88]
MKKNIELAHKAFYKASSDKYDGVHSIYRLAAAVPIPECTSPDGVERQINRLKKELATLNVRANAINFMEDILEIDFYAKDYQMVMTRGQYVGLVTEFAVFLDSSGIEEIFIQYGFLSETPYNDSVLTASNDQINFFPEFNSKCFGADISEKIQVYNFKNS